MNSNPWTRKHAPLKTSDVVGQAAPVERLKRFVELYATSRKKAVILYGPTGCGKTCSVYAVARELGEEVLEVNASDFRDAKSLHAILGPATSQRSLFGGGKIILIDELDGISGRKDRGGVPALAKLIAHSAFPVVITANDPWNKKFSSLRKSADMLEFKTVDKESSRLIVKAVCVKEQVEAADNAVSALINRSGGDMRGLITDLQILSGFSRKLEMKDVNTLSDRNRVHTMKEALVKIFKASEFNTSSSALDDVDEQPNDWFLWIDENLPREYTSPAALAKAYESLSSADLFNGRIRRRQHWRLLVYVKLLLTAGVACAKTEKNPSPASYRQTSRILKLYIAKMRFSRRKAIAEKIAMKTHSSPRAVIRGTVPFLKTMLKNPAFSTSLTNEFELDAEEVEWLQR